MIVTSHQFCQHDRCSLPGTPPAAKVESAFIEALHMDSFNGKLVIASGLRS